MEQKTAKCKECLEDISVWEMELEPIWTCYDCLEKRELSVSETNQILKTALGRLQGIDEALGGLSGKQI